MKKLLFVMLLGLAPPVWAVGTCTVSDVTSTQIAGQNARVADSQSVIVTLACTGDASTGSFPSTTIPLYGASPSGSVMNSYNLTGYYLYQVSRTPGSPAPTANYTTTITDANSFALDLGLLTSNGSAAAAQLTAISTSAVSYPVARSALTVAITGSSVNSAKITLDLVFRANNVASNRGGSDPVVVATPGDTVCALHADTTIGSKSITAVSSTASTMTYTMASVPSYFYAGQIVSSQGNGTAGYNVAPLTVSAVDTTHVTVTSAANPGAGTAGGTLSLYCSNQVTDGATVAFASQYTIPANTFGVSRSSYSFLGQVLLFSSASTIPTTALQVTYGGSNVYSASNGASTFASEVGVTGFVGFTITALSSTSAVVSSNPSYLVSAANSTFAFGDPGNQKNPVAVTTTTNKAVAFATNFSNTTAGNAWTLLSLTVR